MGGWRLVCSYTCWAAAAGGTARKSSYLANLSFDLLVTRSSCSGGGQAVLVVFWISFSSGCAAVRAIGELGGKRIDPLLVITRRRPCVEQTDREGKGKESLWIVWWTTGITQGVVAYDRCWSADWLWKREEWAGQWFFQQKGEDSCFVCNLLLLYEWSPPTVEKVSI